MTAKEILKQNQEQAFYNQNSDYRIKSMQEYARLKCQELLLIVAEKAELGIKTEGLEKIVMKTYKTYSQGGHGEPSWCTKIYIDKDSILNAVDLDSFCS